MSELIKDSLQQMYELGKKHGREEVRLEMEIEKLEAEIEED